MAKQLAQLVLAGAQVVGRAFARAVRQEITLSQQAAKNRNSASKSANHFHNLTAKPTQIFNHHLILYVAKDYS